MNHRYRTSVDRHRRGFSLVEVMVTMVVMVVSLVAVTSATTSATLIRKRGQEESAVLSGMVSRLDWARGQLYSASGFHDGAMEALDAGQEEYTESFILDADGNGEQDLCFAAGEPDAPILRVSVRRMSDAVAPMDAVRVSVDATWYGVGGNRNRSESMLVANRLGYEGD